MLGLLALDPTQLAEYGGGRAEGGLPRASGVGFHSERVRPGDAFFALPGAAQHGLAFADASLAAGAAFIVSDKPHPQGVTVPDPAGLLLELGRAARRSLTGPVIGVTGSAGKTSTKALLAAALGAAATPGNFNTPLALAQVLVDTALAGRTGAEERLVLELGIDHPGEMDVLLSVAQPTHGVVTLLAASHLSGLGTVETVAAEKLKLVDAAAHAFVSSQAAPFLSAGQRQKTTTYGVAEPAETTLPEPDLHGIDVCGTLAERSHRGQMLSALGVTVRLPFVGAALAENALAALAVATFLGDDPGAASARLAGAQLEGSRLQVHKLGSLTLLDDSYNSNPASASAALEALSFFPEPHSAVLGDMLELGAASARYHRELGARTRGLAQVIAVGSAMRALRETNPEAVHLDAFDLEALEALAPTHGTLLVKGSRGMKLERLVAALLSRAQTNTQTNTQTNAETPERPSKTGVGA